MILLASNFLNFNIICAKIHKSTTNNSESFLIFLNIKIQGKRKFLKLRKW